MDWALAISAAALIASAVALWRTHYARFSARWMFGSASIHLYAVGEEAERRYCLSVAVPLSVSNEGARTGAVQALRLRARYPELPDSAHEFVRPIWQFERADAQKITNQRAAWIREAANWMPSLVLPKSTVTTVVVFETWWYAVFAPGRVEFDFEAWTDVPGEWLPVGVFDWELGADTWVALLRGDSWSVPFRNDAVSEETRWHPPDLHPLPS